MSYNKTILPSGMVVVTESLPSVQSVAIGAWIKVGARYESARTNGIGHFVEHMIFKGTQNRSTFDIAKSLETVGGNLNAFTNKEQTCIFAYILKRDLALAVDVVADLVCNPVFPASELEKEKGVIIEEINSLDDAPEELVHEYFQENLFHRHPLEYGVLGTRENIRRFSRDDLYTFWEKSFRADRIVVAITGAVEHESVVSLVEQAFSLPSVNGQQKPQNESRNPQTIKFKEIERPAYQAHLCIGSLAPSYASTDKYTLMLLSTIIGGGMSSRLFQKVREEHGLAYSVYSFHEFLSDIGLFGVYAGTDAGKVPECQNLIYEEFRNLCEHPVDEGELERTKSQLIGNFILGMESTSGRMTRLARMELYAGKYIPIEDVVHMIEQVTVDDVRTVAQKVILAENLQTTMITPANN